MLSDGNRIDRLEKEKMRKSKVVLTVAVVMLGMVATGWAQDPVSFEVTADVFSKYVWRGQNITDDWSFQPGVSATYAGLTAGVWGALDLTDENGESGEFIEFDWYVDYSGQITEMIGFSVGGIYYVFPGAGETTEIYAGLSFDTIASPSVTVYYDIDEVEGMYVALGAGHTIENIEGLEDMPFAIDLSANLGWGDSSYNDAYWGVDSGELNDLTLSAAFPFEVGPVSVTPSVTFVTVLGGDISDVADDDSLVYFGVGAAYGF